MDKEVGRRVPPEQVFAEGSVLGDLNVVKEGVETETSAALGARPDHLDQPPADSAREKAREGKYPAIPDQSGRNSELDDGESVAEAEYKAVHNAQPAPRHRDEIYRRKSTGGK
jgi:hypothetical protein